MKKYFSLILILLLILSAIGCRQQMQAELYDNAADWINEDFAKNNLVRPLGDSDDSESPKTLTFVVDDEEEYNQIFNENAKQLNIDWNTQMLVVYTFSTEYHRNNEIINLAVENDVLKITYQMEKKYGVGDASQPYQRWFVVKLDKLEVDSVVFEESE